MGAKLNGRAPETLRGTTAGWGKTEASAAAGRAFPLVPGIGPPGHHRWQELPGAQLPGAAPAVRVGRAALAWAETVTRISRTGAPDSAYAAVSAHFDEKELVDLTLAIGLMNTDNRMAISFRRPPAAVSAKPAEAQGNRRSSD
jgi:alkylhydroperoxidase family enzyme